MESEKFKKLNISIPPDLHAWIKKKQADFKKSHQFGKLDISPFIAHCIRAMKDAEEQEQKKSVGAVIEPKSKISVSGYSTATKKSSRRAG